MNSNCRLNFPLPRNRTYSQAFGIRMWTFSGGIFCLPQSVIWIWLSWVLCLRISYKTEIKVSSKNDFIWRLNWWRICFQALWCCLQNSVSQKLLDWCPHFFPRSWPVASSVPCLVGFSNMVYDSIKVCKPRNQ